MMMRCSKAEHDKLFPRDQNEYQENQNLVGVPSYIETLQVSYGIFTEGTNRGGESEVCEGNEGIQKFPSPDGYLHAIAYSYSSNRKESDNRVRCRYVHSTGFWRRIR